TRDPRSALSETLRAPLPAFHPNAVFARGPHASGRLETVHGASRSCTEDSLARHPPPARKVPGLCPSLWPVRPSGLACRISRLCPWLVTERSQSARWRTGSTGLLSVVLSSN